MPGLRRLRDPQQRAKGYAGPGHSARKGGFCFRHWLLVAISLLHEHLRLSQHPRTRAGDCDGNQIRQSRTQRLGDYGRRRRAVNWRQSFHARAAAQPGHQLHSFQQPHLWFDERTVQSNLSLRAANEVDADGRD